MDLKSYTDFLLSKEIELKECEADLLRIIGRLRQAGIYLELPNQKRSVDSRTRNASSGSHNKADNTNDVVNSDEPCIANAPLAGATDASSLYEDALKEPNFDDFGVSKKTIELLELWKLGIPVPFRPAFKTSNCPRSMENLSFKPPVTTTTFKNSEFTYTPELFEKNNPTRAFSWKNEIYDCTATFPKLKLSTSESPIRTPPSIQYQLLQHGLNTSNSKSKEYHCDSESLSVTKPFKSFQTSINVSKENKIGRPKPWHNSEFFTPQKSPVEPQLSTPLLHGKQLLDSETLGVPASPELIATKWL